MYTTPLLTAFVCKSLELFIVDTHDGGNGSGTTLFAGVDHNSTVWSPQCLLVTV